MHTFSFRFHVRSRREVRKKLEQQACRIPLSNMFWFWSWSRLSRCVGSPERIKEVLHDLKILEVQCVGKVFLLNTHVSSCSCAAYLFTALTNLSASYPVPDDVIVCNCPTTLDSVFVRHRGYRVSSSMYSKEP